MVRVLIGEPARDTLARSLRPGLHAIEAALGPDGRAVLYYRDGRPTVAQDALEIAREVAGEAGAGSIAPRILKEVLAEAKRDLGDGTGRLACLLVAAYAEGVRLVASGISPAALADEMLALQDRLTELLRAARLAPLPAHSTALAACRDPGLAEAVAQAHAHSGPDGSVDLVSGYRRGIELRTGTGFVLEVEPVSHWLGPAAPERLEFPDVHVLVVDGSVSALGRLAGVLEGFAMRGKALLLLAREVTGTALETLVVNQRAHALRVAALRPAAVTSEAAGLLEDLAIATGATLVSEALGTTLDALRPGMLGRAGGLVVAAARATLAEPAGDPGLVANRRHLLLAEAERQRYLALDRERLERRAARLAGRWAELRVGGDTEAESEGRLARARSALAAVRAADAEGVIATGSVLHTVAGVLRTEASRLPAAAPRAARLCVAAGCAALARRITPDHGMPEPVLDPLAITASLVRRAVSAAATMLRTEAIIAAQT